MVSKSIPISKTKIIVPYRRQEILSRSRLLESMKSLLDNKLLLLSAPAGYGKTSLLIDLAHTIDMPVCWLSIDLLDREPQRFLAYLIASLTEQFPGIGEASRPQLNRLKSMEQDAESLLVTLTNEIYEQIEEDFLLIIDDFHLLDDFPVISALVNRFLELVVENCHVLLSSRTLPNLDDVTLMVAREQVAGLSHAELAFSPREAQALYALNHHQHLSEEAAKELIDQTSGWITGMVLSHSPGMTRVSGVDTFAYLGRQVLDQQPEPIREFLMRTSLPEEFNSEFCEFVLAPLYSEPQNWFNFMSLIFEKNLFILPLGDDGRWLRYHPLFREFLQTRLREERPQEIQPILERMALAYEKAGEWEKAYFTCKQLNDFEALAGVIERSGTAMLQTALVTLEGWINSLPPGMVRTRPGLISLRGMMSSMKGNLEEASRLLDTAVSMYRRNDHVAGLTLALTRRANTLRLTGKYHASLRDIDEVLHLSSSTLDLQPHYAEGLRLKGLNLHRLGESRHAIEAFEHSLSLYTAINETGSIPILLMETGMVYHAIGEIDSAKRSYQNALKLRQAEKNLYYQAEILNNLAVLYHQMGEYELACETFENGLDCARKSRNLRTESVILTGLGDLYSELEEFETAVQAYEQAETIAHGLPGFFISNYLILAHAHLALLQEDNETASKILRSFKKQLRTNPSNYERGLWAFFEGRNHLMKGETKKAISILKEGKACFAEDGRETEGQACLVWLIGAYEQIGQRTNARSEFQELLTMRNSPAHALFVTLHQTLPWLQSLRSDSEIGRNLSSLLDKSKKLSDELISVRRRLRRHAQSIQLPAAGITIRAFGRAEVVVNGRIVAMSEWKTKSVRDLFFYFLFREDAMTKEQIGEALWPDVDDPQILKARFKDEIYRLRRAVGKNVIILDEVYYRFNRALDYDYDVEAFESYVTRARKTKDILKGIECYQKAVDMVQGPYLNEVDARWVIEERQRLGQMYMSALESLAHLYLDSNQLEKCLSICQRALLQDRYNEVIYQVGMRAYAALGDRVSIARQYQACKIALKEGLGLLPSQETESIYRELTVT